MLGHVVALNFASETLVHGEANPSTTTTIKPTNPTTTTTTPPEHHATDHMMKSGQHEHVMIIHNLSYPYKKYCG